jgi:hypothetical protein
MLQYNVLDRKIFSTKPGADEVGGDLLPIDLLQNLSPFHILAESLSIRLLKCNGYDVYHLS